MWSVQVLVDASGPSICENAKAPFWVTFSCRVCLGRVLIIPSHTKYRSSIIVFYNTLQHISSVHISRHQVDVGYIIIINHHHHKSVMDLGHLLTRSGVTYPEVSSKFCHNSFCQLGNGVSLPWVIYYEAFYLHVLSSFSCIPVICPELVLFLIHL